jgi:hypothetical protein
MALLLFPSDGKILCGSHCRHFLGHLECEEYGYFRGTNFEITKQNHLLCHFFVVLMGRFTEGGRQRLLGGWGGENDGSASSIFVGRDDRMTASQTGPMLLITGA